MNTLPDMVVVEDDGTIALATPHTTKPELVCTLKNVDLHSYSETLLPEFVLASPIDYNYEDIVAYGSEAPATVCVLLKAWLLDGFAWYDESHGLDPKIMRMESQELDKIAYGAIGRIICFRNAFFRPGDVCPGGTIILVLVDQEEEVRIFYTGFPEEPDFIAHMSAQGFLSPEPLQLKRPKRATLEPLFRFAMEHFERGWHLPDHPHFENAIFLLDHSIHMLNPGNAVERLEADENLNNSVWKSDIRDDRYLFWLHPAESKAASLVGLPCATYMLVKRNFFHAYYEALDDCYRYVDGRHNILPTDHDHAKWIEQVYGWFTGKAEVLVRAWKILGFLDEVLYLAWLRAGGLMIGYARFARDYRGGDEDGVAAEGAVRRGRRLHR